MQRRLKLDSGDEAAPAGDAPTALAAVLDAQGRRLVWVADRLGVDSSPISRWRSGERPISELRRLELAVVLEVDPRDLLDAATTARSDRGQEGRR